MHSRDQQLSGDIATPLNVVGGESLNGSGFETDQPESIFESDDSWNAITVEGRQ